MNKILLVSIASAIASTSTYAQDNTQLADTVVTASRTPQKLDEVLSDLSVITAEEIQKAGQTSLVELLNAQPGLEVAHNGGIGKESDVYIRGANPTHTLILVDGMRISSATKGTTALQHIPLAQIERIEILRGPASSLYGADAIGGVIQIFTKSAKGAPRFNGSIGLGTYGTSIVNAGVSGRVNDTSFSLQAGAVSTNGISAIANPKTRAFNPDDDGYRNQSLSANLAHHFNDNHEVGLTTFITDSKNFFDSGTTLAAAKFEYYNEQTLLSYSIYSKNRFTNNWLSTLRVGQAIDDLTSYTKRPTSITKSLAKTEQNQYSWQNDISTELGLFTLGAERLEQKVDTSTAFSVTERDIQSWLAGWQGVFGNNSLQAHIRNDDNSQFGNHTTGSASYGYQFTSVWRANIGYGTAFNAPTFNQLYSPLSSVFVGNPNLKPEEARNKEIGLHYDDGTHSMGAVYYHNEVQDLIVNAGNPVRVPTNVGEATLRGLTLTYQGTLVGLKIGVSADFQRPEDEATGNLLPRRAKRNATFSVSKQLGDWDIGCSLEGSSRRFDDAANTTELDGYTIANVFANYRIKSDWSLNARVNNVFDRDYELAKNYGTPGINALLTLRYAPNP